MATEAETEAILAAIGLQALMDGRPRLGKAKLVQAATMGIRIRRRLLRFLGTDEWAPAAPIPKFDYAKVLDQISAKQIPDATQAAALFTVVPDKELAHDVGLLADRICQAANALIPREDRNLITGQPEEDPEPAATADFVRFWQVACDPEAVFADLEDGSLIDDQVTALAQLYPATFADIGVAIQEVMGKLVASRPKGWEPLPTKGRLLATLKQQDILDAQLAGAIQASYAAEAAVQEQAAPPPPRQAPRNDKPAGEATPGQTAAGS